MTMANWIFILLGVLFMVALLSRYMMVQDRRRHSRRRGGSGESDAEQIEIEKSVLAIFSQLYVIFAKTGFSENHW